MLDTSFASLDHAHQMPLAEDTSPQVVLLNTAGASTQARALKKLGVMASGVRTEAALLRRVKRRGDQDLVLLEVEDVEDATRITNALRAHSWDVKVAWLCHKPDASMARAAWRLGATLGETPRTAQRWTQVVTTLMA